MFFEGGASSASPPTPPSHAKRRTTSRSRTARCSRRPPKKRNLPPSMLSPTEPKAPSPLTPSASPRRPAASRSRWRTLASAAFQFLGLPFTWGSTALGYAFGGNPLPPKPESLIELPCRGDLGGDAWERGAAFLCPCPSGMAKGLGMGICSSSWLFFLLGFGHNDRIDNRGLWLRGKSLAKRHRVGARWGARRMAERMGAEGVLVARFGPQGSRGGIWGFFPDVLIIRGGGL